jgi:transcriptional regulator with XRE-family HTH domain
MAKSTEALVDPPILKWARESSGLSTEEAARSLQTTDKRVLAWEGGQARPTMAQLRRMATVYKRQLNLVTSICLHALRSRLSLTISDAYPAMVYSIMAARSDTSSVRRG